jgi:hypothetical protein
MSDFALKLGSSSSKGFEIPDHIQGLGGEQMLVKHQLVGGRSSWSTPWAASPAPSSGAAGSAARTRAARARKLDRLRKAGGS